MSAALREPLRVGAAVLSADRRTLRGPRGDVPVRPQPARLLLCLARAGGRVVPLDALIAALRDPYGRANARLVQAHMCDVRAALAESGSGAVAETLYGVGVRLRVPAAGEAGTGPREAA